MSISQSWRLPAICMLCQQYHYGEFVVCASCRLDLPRLGFTCYNCATPLPHKESRICGACTQQKPFIDRALITYRFEEPLRGLLHDFKYHAHLYLGYFLAALMTEAIEDSSYTTDCLIPVPLHSKRLRQRGFNQAALLAKHLANHLQLNYDHTYCHKIINTTSQANLNQEARRSNLFGAFRVKPIPFQHVTIIDDLFTTGNTANELAKTLKKNGVKRVDVWCCARAI